MSFILNLISSIREIDIRIRELQEFILNKQCKEECIEDIKKRIRALIDTRFKLTFTLVDLKYHFISVLSAEEKKIFEESNLYKYIKRDIGLDRETFYGEGKNNESNKI